MAEFAQARLRPSHALGSRVQRQFGIIAGLATRQALQILRQRRVLGHQTPAPPARPPGPAGSKRLDQAQLADPTRDRVLRNAQSRVPPQRSHPGRAPQPPTTCIQPPADTQNRSPRQLANHTSANPHKRYVSRSRTLTAAATCGSRREELHMLASSGEIVDPCGVA